MKKIESHQMFLQEYKALLEKIDENISNLGQYGRVELSKPSIALIERLNRLKLHRKKLETTLEKYSDVSDETWMVIRNHVREVFREAQQEWLEHGEEL